MSNLVKIDFKCVMTLDDVVEFSFYTSANRHAPYNVGFPDAHGESSLKLFVSYSLG